MNIYLVRNKDKGGYLHIQYNHLVTWVPKEKCTAYTEHKLARHAGMYAFNNDEDAREKFEIEHLIARDETIARPYTKDGKPIFPGEFYWQTYSHGVERVQIIEISTTYYSDHEQIDCYCRLDVNFWVSPKRLYSTEPLAWVAWKEAQ